MNHNKSQNNHYLKLVILRWCYNFFIEYLKEVS